MPNVKGLLADPEFNKLDPMQQRHVLGQVDPQFSQLSDEDYQTFRQKVTPVTPSSVPFADRTPQQQQSATRRARHSLTGNEAPRPSLPAQAADLMEGTAKYSSGALLPAAMAAPGATAAGLMGGAAGMGLGNIGGRMLGLGEDGSRLAGDVASIPGAMMGEGAWNTISPYMKALTDPAVMRAGVEAIPTGKSWMKAYDTFSGAVNKNRPSVPPPPTFGPTAPSPGTNARFVPGQYDAPRPQRPQPVNSSSLPEGVFPPPAPVPEPVPAPVLKPSGSMGKGPQAGYTPKPFKPEPINRKSLPEGVIPPPPAPAPEPVTPVPASVPGARFKPGQYDAKISKPPVETGGGHVPDYKYEGMGPEEFAKRSKEIDAERTAAAKAKVATIAPPPAPSAAAPLASTAEQSLPGGKAVITDDQIPVKAHETNVKVDQQIKDKVNNLAEYSRSKGDTPEHLDMIGEDPALTRQYLNEAHSYGKNKGNTVPKTGYKGLDKGSDSFKQVRQKIMDMIDEEKNKP